MERLNVELYGTLLGTLVPTERSFTFKVDPRVFEVYPLASTVMSLAVPLNPRFTNVQQKRSQNFFNELLPEGRNLTWLMQSMPQSNRSTFDLLRKHGKDNAGALVIYDPDDNDASKPPKVEKVDKKRVRYLLEHMPQEPLANAPVSGKTSLGGVQGKIVLVKKGDAWYRAHYGYPSTHILKPVVPEYPTMIYDEAFGMQMAMAAGLTEHPVWIEDFDSIDALVIERFDRNAEYPTGRIHQEDFNQALGAHGDQKYQEHGGKVSAKRIAQTLQRFASDEDVKRFAAQMIFAVAIGNVDMHAKNISVFHHPDARVCLTPTYDQVPLRHQNTDGRLALAIDGKYVHASIARMDIEAEILSWRQACFSSEAVVHTFVDECLERYRDALDKTELHTKAYYRLKDEISLFITNLLSGNPTGKTS